MSEILTLLFIFIGTALSLLSSFGFLRLPDVYTRSHAGTKSVTLGLLSILTGAFLYFWLNTALSASGWCSERERDEKKGCYTFVFLTAPVAGRMIARSAYRSGVKLADISAADELKEDLEKMKQENKESLN